jgi:type VI protein secretion system component Hcp
MPADMFLKIGDIKGESSFVETVQKYEALIDDDILPLLTAIVGLPEAESFSFKYSELNVPPEGLNRVTENVTLNFAKINADYTPQDSGDRSVAEIYDDLAAQLDAAGVDASLQIIAEDTQQEYLIIKMKEVFVSSFPVVGSNDLLQIDDLLV